MQRNIALALSLAIGSVAIAGSAAGQRTPPAGTPVQSAPASSFGNQVAQQRAQIDAFRKGLEISVDGGSSWRAGQLDTYVSPCPSSTTSPCGTGAANFVKFKVRFPAIASALDLTNGKHYYVALIENLSARGTSSHPLCDSGFYIDQPGPNMVVEFFPTGTWATLPAPNGSGMVTTCHWAVTAKVNDGLVVTRPLVLWSDTVSVIVHGR